MKLNNNRVVLMTMAFIVLMYATACQAGTETRTGNANSATNTTAPAPANTNQPPVAKTENTAPAEAVSLATPTDAYKFGYAARKNKDIAGLKRVLSKEALQFLEDVGKEEKKTLDDQLKALAERPQAPTAEVRNEKINGDRATLEYLTEKGTWTTMDFVKEDGDWKIGLPKAQ